MVTLQEAALQVTCGGSIIYFAIVNRNGISESFDIHPLKLIFPQGI